MRYLSWLRIRSTRRLVILIALLVYLILLTWDALYYFPANEKVGAWLPWLTFGFSAFVALMFLAVGTVVWLYARDRYVARFLFCFSLAMMVTFALETGAPSDNTFSAIAGAASALAMLTLSILLLLFPKNYFSSPSTPEKEREGRFSVARGLVLFLRVYVTLLTCLGIIATFYSFADYLLHFHPVWLHTLVYSYDAIASLGILATIVVSSRRSFSLRERQQQKLFLGGLLLAFAPVVLLTILPITLHLPFVDPQLSTLTFTLFPLLFGYSILRYQVLVFDRYIRRAVSWIIGGVELALLGYLVVTVTTVFLANSGSLALIVIASAMIILAPFVWWSARWIVDRFFFAEIANYRRLIEAPDLMARETFDLNEASNLLTLAAVNAFNTQAECLFVLDDDTGCYQLYSDPKDDANQVARQNLVQHVWQEIRSSTPIHTQTDWLSGDEAIIERLQQAKRPLLLSEATREDGHLPIGLSRYLSTTTSDQKGTNPLLAPVRAHGKMIGILVLGERGDHQQYAGPDLEAIHLLLARFSPVLETARLYAQGSRHGRILNTLYTASTIPGESFRSLEDVASAYATIAAEAVQAGAQFWLYDVPSGLLRLITHTGAGPQLVNEALLKPTQDSNWTSWFCQGDSPRSWHGPSSAVPPCLPETPGFPFAWIPLKRDQHRLGILVLTYPRPHHFAQEERRVLEMFANQCAVTLDNTRINLELREAYERQKELDQLKDQFIMTASHELRTPLTAVQGYIELLNEYYETLPSAALGDFIAKAYRGCEELSLLVGNIMDASHIEIDARNIHLSQVPLKDSVQHILEILEAMTSRDKRTLQVDIPADVGVLADNIRLGQVVLNLMSNALKYSSSETSIEISSEVSDDYVT
jgi:GAF domain-containing protein